MTLGMDRDATKHRRWQNTYLAGALVFGMLAAGLLAAVAVYTLSGSGNVAEDGELPSVIVAIVVPAALMAGCIALGRRHDRQRAEVVADTGRWLPSLTERNGEGQVDLDVETARLRPLAPRAVGLLLVWVVVLAGVIAGFVAMSASADNLLKNGARVSGEVLGVYKHTRAPDTIHVSYQVKYGDLRFATIVWDSDHQYTEGQQITVIFDKTDPDRVRTLYETNDDQTWIWALVIGLIGVLTGIPLSVIAAVNWRRRYRAVRATGWRIASVTVVPDYPVRRGRHMPDIHVQYRDGTGITLRAATSSHGSVPMKHHPNRRAWIGGTDRDMVVLFPHGRWRKPPYAVPAYALNLRADAQPAPAPVPEDPEKAALLKRKFRLFIVAMGVWYVAWIAGVVVFAVQGLGAPAAIVAAVGALAPLPLTKIYFARVRARLEE